MPADLAFSRRQSFKDEAELEAEELSFRRLTREEAAGLSRRNPSVSPWRVIAAQAFLGAAITALAWWFTGSASIAVSALYGGLVVVLPGALMARGTTGQLPHLAPMIRAVMVMSWAVVKMGASVLMLLLAPKIVPALSWPALLIALVACMQVY
ncbi:MAG: ATP synthase subunit I, partial [Pseudomonadota bacterium]|nr:ATP synthase subunit I [Pseudomonadota bacterium]